MKNKLTGDDLFKSYMKNKLTGKSIQHYYIGVLSGLMTMDEFFELSMILPTKNLEKRNQQILNIL